MIRVVLWGFIKFMFCNLLFIFSNGDENVSGWCLYLWVCFCIMNCINILVNVIVVNIEVIKFRVMVIVNFLIGLLLNMNNKFIVMSVVKLVLIMVVKVF